MPYEPDCKTDSRVYVNGTRLPASDVDVWMRKEGPLDIGRYAEVEFASPFRRDNYATVFDGLDPDNQSDWDTLRVEIKDYQTDEYTTEFHGMVTAVGNGVGPEQLWKARAQGPALFTDKIAASQTFDDPTVGTILKYAAFAMAEKLPLTIPVETDGTELDRGVIDSIGDNWFGIIGDAARFLDGYLTSKSFQSNKHTIADVVNWLKGKTGTRLWFEPTQQGAILVGSTEPTEVGHTAHYEGGNTAIINNDALVEVNPVNTIKVNGKAANSLFEGTDFEIHYGGDRYYRAKARHKPLYERAGKTEYLGETEFASDANTSDEVKNEAKSALKDAIDSATSGDMQTLLKTPIKPFDTITARPTCQSSPATDVQPITYEVSRVHHQIRTGSSDEQTMTELNVGVHAALDDIEIVDSWNPKA
jgi:hypothetical protein